MNVFGMPSAIVVPRVVQAFIRSRLEELLITSTYYSLLSLQVSRAHIPPHLFLTACTVVIRYGCLCRSRSHPHLARV